MRKVIYLIALVIGLSCKKNNCKLVTVIVVNGCSNPPSQTTVIKDQEFCGAELEEIRKQKGTVTIPTSTGNCTITTAVLEK